MATEKNTAGEPVKSYQEILAEMTQKLKKLQETKQLDELDAQVLIDEWSSQDPFAIIGYIEPENGYPMGQMLAWRNPRLRDQSASIGWAGWIPLEYGDNWTGKNGELLTRYLKEIPARLQGTTQLDRYVRRGDAILCRLPMQTWQRRQLDREAKYLNMRNQLKEPTETPVHKMRLDGGLEDQKPGNVRGAIGGFTAEQNEIGTEKGHAKRVEKSEALKKVPTEGS